MNKMTRFLGKKLAHFLSQKNRHIGLVPATNRHKLMACLQPVDVHHNQNLCAEYS